MLPWEPQPPCKELCSLLVAGKAIPSHPAPAQVISESTEGGGSPKTGRNLQHGADSALHSHTLSLLLPSSLLARSAPGHNVPVLRICDSWGQAKPPVLTPGCRPPTRPSAPHSTGRHSVEPLPRAGMTSCTSKHGERFFQLRQAQLFPRNLPARRVQEIFCHPSLTCGHRIPAPSVWESNSSLKEHHQ